MALQSANTLFRFTSKLDYLLNTLSKGFSPRLSSEVNYRGEERSYPMVCFCDIPLAMVDNHMLKFGDYGIGMTKEWGIRNGLNPVLYYNRESILIKNFFDLIKQNISGINELHQLGVDGQVDGDGRLQFERNERNLAIDKVFWPTINTSFSIMYLERFFKPNKGAYTINDKYYPDYSFYDEREWRYLPFDMAFRFDNENEREKFNEDVEIGGEYTLSFNCDDIKYIIVNKDDEILEIVNFLENLSTNDNSEARYSHNEITLLTSRIITTSQIRDDF